MHVKKSLIKNLDILKSKLQSEDITFLDVKIGKTDACLIFVNDLTDKEHMGELILKPASAFKGSLSATSFFSTFLTIYLHMSGFFVIFAAERKAKMFV